jgi:two-component system response regulator AtoC
VHLVHLEHEQGGRIPLPPFLVGISPEIRSVFRQVRVFASAGGQGADVPVLVLGETGTGKEVVAKLLHFLSPRRERPFVAVNCAAIPEALLESELFGSVRGAFTGATDREGLFEAAGEGTLFLDEIGEMPPSLQAKLLRVLQEGLVRRVGESREKRVRARIVAATNREIGAMVSGGRFREDLLYRLGMLSVALPPLAGRRQDIELLVNSFIVKHVPLAGDVEDVDRGPVRELLAAQPYPGNVRELEGVVMKSLILASASGSGRLSRSHVQEALKGRVQPAALPGGSPTARAREAMAHLADAVLEDLVGGRRPATSLPDLESEFGRLGLAYQLTQAVERRLAGRGERRRGPTDEEARAWFGYSGASSYRRWLAAARRSHPPLEENEKERE